MGKTIAGGLTVSILIIMAVLWNDSNHSVAMVDLDKEANEIGRAELIASKVNHFVKTEKVVLNEFRGALNKAINDLKETAGDKPTKKQSQELLQAIRKAEAEMQKRIAIIQKKASELKVKLVLEFRNEVTPIIETIAVDQKFDVVEIFSPRQIYINQEIDISDNVISHILKTKPKKSDKSNAASETKSPGSNTE